LGDGAGGFGTGATFGANTPYSVVSADFNGDGTADLAVATQYTVLIALGNGVGNFATTSSFGTGHVYVSMATADFNGDNVADLAMAGSNNSVWILIGDGSGSFGSVQALVLAYS
jgi:hypothetical protein